MADDYAHRQDVTTRWNDNDQYGHLNNVVHHEIMDIEGERRAALEDLRIS